MQQHLSGDTEQRSGKRQSIGKRKLSDQGESSQPSQRTLSELLVNNSNHHDHRTSWQNSSSSNKRSRFSHSPSPSHSSSTASQPVPPSKMYNFSGSPPKNKAAFGRSVPGSEAASSVKPKPFKAGVRQVQNQSTQYSPVVGSKKLVVKNLRSGARSTHEPYFEKVWSKLDAALTAVFEGREPETSLEELYKGSENACRQGQAPALAKKLQDRCKEHVAGKLRPNLVTRAGGGTDVDTLRAVIEAWTAWNTRLITVRWIFYYLDQSFLMHTKEYPNLRELGLNQFRSHIFSNQTLKPKILQGACDLIAADRGARTGIMADSPLLRNSIELFHSLDVYASDFEPVFSAQSQIFLTSWAQEQASGPLASYAENSHRLIEREVERCGLYSLNRSTKQKLSEILDQTLVSEQEAVLLSEKDILGLMRAENKTALKQLYGLLERQYRGVQLKNAFSSYIVEEGSGIVFDEGEDVEMVPRLLQFKRQLDDIWRDAFDRNEKLGHTLREAFGHFMNLGKKTESTGGTDNPKTGEMIAKYVDRLLKGGWRIPPSQSSKLEQLADEDAEIDRQLEQVLDLFRFVHGKAVFEAFYKNDLARRLLMGRSASDVAEKNMLDRLQKECGTNFTHNLESMFKDIDVARDEMAAYSSLLRERDRKYRPPVDLHVSVLGASAWPTYPDVPVRIPSNLAASIHDFEKFYHNKHTGRKLSWKHQLAHCQLRAWFPKGYRELVVSSFQAIVLLLFNDIPPTRACAIRRSRRQRDSRTLQSLACAKYRVLTKDPKGKEVAPTDEFSWNAGFTDQKMRIKINQIQLKETKEENKITHERVEADRRYETQAAVVRIMKSRKVIKHSELIAEVIEATRSRGTLQPTEIKTEIGKLIEKDYMERAEGNQYKYVA
ncbi:hypothetical protein NUU61_004078 [Penicillium alfredii]|uniref:Cullin family profile domain-containing protein n=1 Tax=Penicillium alfredii TaxID=1506179 RepID=A0A9W9FKF7_9EURO|nr:uncharacterized protein NUU61_004078 [Penicillium alfredii]KAJ5101856.1 hypothetical protein NUU61_004078 [Penicillium alfredii]